MYRKKRLQSVASLAQMESPQTEFTVDHVYDIRSAVICLLDAVAAVVEMKAGSAPESYSKMTQQVCALDEKQFKEIHERYLWWSSSFLDDSNVPRSTSAHLQSAKPNIRTTSQHGFAIKYSRVEADRFLKSLLMGFDMCKDVLIQSLKRRSAKETSLYHQLVAVKGDLVKKEDEVKFANNKLDDFRREKELWVSNLDKLKEELKAAKDEVFKLERHTSVMTWQKKLDETANKHILEVDELTTSLESERIQHQQTCENLTSKISKLENEVKRLKLRNQLPVSATPNNYLHEKLDHLKQQLFLREQKIHGIRKELCDQQRRMVGCLHGLQQDFKYILGKLEFENPGKGFSPDEHNVKFQAMLRVLHDACVKGKLSELEGSLPPQYAITTLACLSPLENKRNRDTSNVTSTKITSIDTSSNSLLPKFQPRSNSVHNRLPPKTDFNRPASARSSFCKTTKPLSTNQTKPDSVKPPHPQLVNPVTGRANLLLVMRHFPYLTVEQVSEQWDNFRKYDKNKDFSLDLPELYEVIQDVCGLKVTVGEMREAMLEVDRDQSNNIDFYEYLKIAEMIIRKQGSAAIFKSDMLEERGVTTSQACIIQ